MQIYWYTDVQIYILTYTDMQTWLSGHWSSDWTWEKKVTKFRKGNPSRTITEMRDGEEMRHTWLSGHLGLTCLLGLQRPELPFNSRPEWIYLLDISDMWIFLLVISEWIFLSNSWILCQPEWIYQIQIHWDILRPEWIYIILSQFIELIL